MPTIIKDKSITETPFIAVSAEDADTMASNVLLPLTFWLEHQEELEGRNDVGVWVDADEEVEVLAGFVNAISVIGLNFPTFYDGRSLSSATILRRTFGYEGELRAIGDVRRDQMEQMQRCGINAFELAQGQDPEKALASLAGFTYNYQVSVDRPAPLFRQR